MGALVDSLIAEGWSLFHNGGGTHVLRKGRLILSGADGDLPDSGWFMLALYRDWDSDLDSLVWSATDASAEGWHDMGGPLDIRAAIAEGEAREIALAFADRLRAALSAEQWQAMRARNATPEYSIAGGPCASHDFTDSNEYMAEAFAEVMGREILPEGAEEIPQADCAFWGLAWEIARREYLTESGK